MTTAIAPAPSLAASSDTDEIRVQPRYGYDPGFDWSDWERRMGIATQLTIVSNGLPGRPKA